MVRQALLGCALAALLLPAAAGAETSTWYGFSVGVSSGPPPPMFGWHAQPQVVVVQDVAVVRTPDCDEDVFRYGGGWWRMREGWWYRSHSWRGPWRPVDVRHVPHAVLVVPAENWRHHPHGGPPGQLRRWEREERHEDRRWKSGDGDGHGNGDR